MLALILAWGTHGGAFFCVFVLPRYVCATSHAGFQLFETKTKHLPEIHRYSKVAGDGLCLKHTFPNSLTQFVDTQRTPYVWKPRAFLDRLLSDYEILASSPENVSQSDQSASLFRAFRGTVSIIRFGKRWTARPIPLAQSPAFCD